MTYGEAVKDPTTKLGQDAVRCAEDRAKRIKAAQKMMAEQGITLEDALLKLWSKSV